MTRNEALKILSQIWGGNPQHDLANSYADAFVALGMLKLDEPEDRAYRVLKHAGLPPTEANNFIDELLKNGLRIVEKS